MEYILIDKRMRNSEKNTLKYLGYKLVSIEKSNNVYPEISSHVDIFTTKIGDTLVVEKSKYNDLIMQLKNSEFSRYFIILFIIAYLLLWEGWRKNSKYN